MATKFPKEDDPHVAEIYRAIALRFHLRYIDARHLAEYHGGDLPDHGRLQSAGEADDRYAAAAEGCVIESAGSAAAALALVHFAGVLAADRLMGEVTQEPVNPERDAYHQSRALANVAAWLNDRAIEDLVKRSKLRAMPPNDNGDAA
jgi:hypothetical protein